MESSAQQKLQKFKILLSKSKCDFSVAEKELEEAFLAAISDPQSDHGLTEKIPLTQKPAQIEILKTKSGKGLWVGGKTFGYKDQLKGLDGSWNKYKQAWIFPLDKQQQLLDLFKLTEQDIGVESQ